MTTKAGPQVANGPQTPPVPLTTTQEAELAQISTDLLSHGYTEEVTAAVVATARARLLVTAPTI